MSRDRGIDLSALAAIGAAGVAAYIGWRVVQWWPVSPQEVVQRLGERVIAFTDNTRSLLIDGVDPAIVERYQEGVKRLNDPIFPDVHLNRTAGVPMGRSIIQRIEDLFDPAPQPTSNTGTGVGGAPGFSRWLGGGRLFTPGVGM